MSSPECVFHPLFKVSGAVLAARHAYLPCLVMIISVWNLWNFAQSG